MLSNFKLYLRKNNIDLKNNKVLLALSGGADSMCLASLFIKAGYNIGVAHCNFGLRDAESDGDEEFVREFALQNDLKCFVKRFNTLETAKEQKTSIEETARNLRYEWFNIMMREEAYDLLATAHNEDDNTETFLLNLIKGRGIQGQTGILSKRKNIIRPLLFASKQDILNYCKKEKIEYRIDSSNSNTDFQRNFVRHKVIPILRELNPKLNKALIHEIGYRRAASEVFQKTIEKRLEEISSHNHINLRLLKDDEIGIYILFKFIEKYGFNFSQAEEMIETQLSGKRFESSTHRAIVHGEYLLIKPNPNSSEGTITIENLGNLIYPIKLNISKVKEDYYSTSNDKNTIYVDAGKLKFPLTLRRWKKGDAYYPMGMKGRKKVSDFFNDNKFSLFDKENAWLLCKDENILWIIGWRADRRFLANKNTKSFLMIQYLSE